MSELTEAVRRSQAIMAENSPGLQTDGRWGRLTNEVYISASSSTQARVDAQLAGVGTSAAELWASHQRRKASSGTAYQADKAAARSARKEQMIVHLRAAAKEVGIDETTLIAVAQLESGFNPMAQNGSSRGLLQLQPAAWADASRELVLPPYETAVFDPRTNSRAGAAYLKLISRNLKKAGYTGAITAPIAYLAYQQGAGGFIELWRASMGKPTKTTFVKAEHMTRNPPPDGGVATTDKGEFFRRWLEVGRKRLGSAEV